MTISHVLQLSNLLFVSFLMNLPLGYFRENSRRFSLRWFLYIHLSIPIIVLLRVSMGLEWTVIPFTIGCAIAGQILGGHLRRRRRP